MLISNEFKQERMITVKIKYLFSFITALFKFLSESFFNTSFPASFMGEIVANFPEQSS